MSIISLKKILQMTKMMSMYQGIFIWMNMKLMSKSHLVSFSFCVDYFLWNDGSWNEIQYIKQKLI